MQFFISLGLATSIFLSSTNAAAIERRQEKPRTCGYGAEYFFCRCMNPNGNVNDLPATQNACKAARGNYMMERDWCRNDYTKRPGLHTLNNCDWEDACQVTNGQLVQVCKGKE